MKPVPVILCALCCSLFFFHPNGTSFGATPPSAEGELLAISTHFERLTDVDLVFPVFNGAATEDTHVWMNPQFGLEILAIEINHRSIPLDEMPVEQPTWDKREILVRKGVCFFYNVNVQHLESVVRENVVVAPRITSVPDQILIRYRVRFPSGDRSQVFATESLNSNTPNDLKFSAQ